MIARRVIFLIWLGCSILALAADRKGWQTFTATAYSVEGETASGKQTRAGRTVAADPDILPVGTRIQIAGAGSYSGVYVVHDTGRKIHGHEVDIFIDNPAEAKRFGKKKVRVRILKQPSK
jgi:3D (Asp-Asp-Asp) domain-containing protein